MTGLAVGDRIKAIDHEGAMDPIHGDVIQVSGWFVFVWYHPEDRERIGYPAKADMYYRDSLWRYSDGETRWRLQLVRECAWCHHEISDPAQAHPLPWVAAECGRSAWKCADAGMCLRRQDRLDQRRGLPPFSAVFKFPIAMLEAACS